MSSDDTSSGFFSNTIFSDPPSSVASTIINNGYEGDGTVNTRLPATTEPIPSPSSSGVTSIGRSAVSRLFEPSKDSDISKNLAYDGDSDDAISLDLSAIKGFGASRKVRFSEKSRKVLEDSDRLLGSIPASRSASYSAMPSTSRALREHSSSPAGGSESTSRFLMHTPRFPRIDFDDMLEEDLEDKKPAWKQLQDNIKSSYHKPKRTIERHRELNEIQDLNLNRRRMRRSESPFAHLDSESFIPRAPSWFASGAMEPRGLNPAGSGPYCAPHVDRSQGIESKPSSSRYDRLVDDNVLPRPFYSRPNRLDPDYFDFDLQHSVNMYKRPEGRYVPRGPQPWETKLLSEFKSKGDAPLSGHMFTDKGLGHTDWRSTGTSYLSAALRTPSFWEHRFATIGSQVRDSNPVSYTSIERNRPVPNKFTEYRDPDFEDYEDPRAPE
ncbi:gex interacting protein 10 [Ditylenchus destructor]|uniref:Gex interacting protein 10 n=1 Tax=Ditylenchus destructor TaxID=166010 RepID=A0AAD4NHL4_9BILA|nr:gex interacting protein 10 [Ditylenchus destructor]